MPEAFEAAVLRHFGLDPGQRPEHVRQVLRQRMQDRRVSSEAAYVASLDAAELAELARALTVGETFFFRNQGHFNALRTAVLPALGQNPRVLSAGCSKGCEPWSLAMELSARGGAFEVVGLDLNPDAIQHARRGVYGDWSLRAVGAEVRQRWFRSVGDRWAVVPERLTGTVDFQVHNLLHASPRLGAARWDLIWCRNLLMYLAPQPRAQVLRRLVASLVPGGFLFVGHAETLRDQELDVRLCEVDGAFFYRRGQALTCTPSLPPPQPVPSVQDLARQQADIARTAARIRALDQRRRPASAPRRPDAAPLLRQAMQSLNAGDTAAARDRCQQVLDQDATNALAWHIRSLCDGQQGRPDQALLHARRATQADPDFAFAWLNLGRLLHGAGDQAGARTALEHAIDRLPKEPADRVGVFGDGFGVSALVRVAQATLKECA